jgi:enoyl-CoA hydratase
MELTLTGDLISATEAKTLGLVNHVVASREELMKLAESVMNKIQSKSPVAVGYAIKSINAGFNFEQSGYKAEAENFAVCTTTEDFKEGTTAFIEKRKPNFSGK